MPIRATRASIEAVIDVADELPQGSLNQFIRPANILVDLLCLDSGYTEEHLKEIETWLAAHFYAIWDRQLVQVQVDVIMETYQSKVGYFLQLTHYGQTAMVMDVDGNLAGHNNSLTDAKKRTAIGLFWLGQQTENLGSPE